MKSFKNYVAPNSQLVKRWTNYKDKVAMEVKYYQGELYWSDYDYELNMVNVTNGQEVFYHAGYAREGRWAIYDDKLYVPNLDTTYYENKKLYRVDLKCLRVSKNISSCIEKTLWGRSYWGGKYTWVENGGSYFCSISKVRVINGNLYLTKLMA